MKTRKFLSVFFLVLLSGVLAIPADAQFEPWEGPEYRADGHLALAIPFEPIDVAEVLNLGFAVGGGGSVFVRRNVELGLRAGYTRFGAGSGPHSPMEIDFQEWTGIPLQAFGNLNLANVGVAVDGGAVSALSLQADIAYHIVTDIPVIPYFVIGPGIYHTQFEDLRWTIEGDPIFQGEPIPLQEVLDQLGIDATGQVAGREETVFGMRLGVGTDIHVGENLILKVEPSYTVLFGAEDNVHFMPIRIGTAYTF